MDPNVEDLKANSETNNYMACLFSHDHREGLTFITGFCSCAEHREPTEQPRDVPCNRIKQRGKKKIKKASPKDFQILFWKRQKR